MSPLVICLYLFFISSLISSEIHWCLVTYSLSSTCGTLFLSCWGFGLRLSSTGTRKLLGAARSWCQNGDLQENLYQSEAQRLWWTMRECGGEELPLAQGQGRDRECQAATAQEWPRGATPCPRSGAAAERSYSMPEVRGGGRGEQPHIQGPMAAWVQEGREELLLVTVRRGGLTRYPLSKVRETKVRW